MKNTSTVLSGIVLAAALAFGASCVQAEGVILRGGFAGPTCCYGRSPVFQQDTLGRNGLVFGGESSTDIIGPYGPCDYDPVECCPGFCDDDLASHGRNH
jgi:hypothetical protein